MLEQIVINNQKQNIVIPCHLSVNKKACEFRVKIKELEGKVSYLQNPDGDCILVEIPKTREVIRQMYAGVVNNKSWTLSDAFDSQFPRP